MVKCMFKKPSPSEGANKEIVLQSHMKSIFAGIDIAVCVFFWRHIFFFSCCFMLFTLCMVKLSLAVRKSVLIWQICFIHLSCLSSQNQHFGIVYCSLFFFCDTFSNTDLKCKEGVLHVWVILPFHLFRYLCYYHVLMLNPFSLRKKKNSW